MFMIFIRQVPRNMMVVHKLFNTKCSLANKEFFLLFPAKILFSVFCFAAWARSSLQFTLGLMNVFTSRFLPPSQRSSKIKYMLIRASFPRK